MSTLDFSVYLDELRKQKPAEEKNLISLEEFHNMLDLAETNPGMKDLLEQALVFYKLSNPAGSKKNNGDHDDDMLFISGMCGI